MMMLCIDMQESSRPGVGAADGLAVVILVSIHNDDDFTTCQATFAESALMAGTYLHSCVVY